MQARPTAAELLAAVADVLEREVVPALDGPVQHHARVAANLAAIIERELRLGPAAAERETAAWQALLGTTDGDLVALRSDAAAALRAGLADHDDGRVWSLLMDTVRDDLAIGKPGHDGWSGE